jgi:hypothetical protein
MADALDAARKSFETEWQAAMPFAPPTLFAVMGPRPEPMTLRDLTARDDLTALLIDEPDPEEEAQ